MSEQNMEQISFYDAETNEEIKLYVLAETTLNEVKYLLLCEEDSEETDAYVFKEVEEEDGMVTVEPVSDEAEYDAIVKVFDELLEDTDLV